jgi:hypothetical protein
MLFIDNKYTRWYYNIITNAQSRSIQKEIYTEKHHIIPKSLGGGNSKTNLVTLTAREHFVCHWLLTKMTLNDHLSKMNYAFIRISFSPYGDRKLTSKKYDIIKNIRRFHTSETKAKISAAGSGINNPNFGKIAWSRGLTKETNEIIKQIAENNKGKPAWNKGLTHTDDTKKKMSAVRKGRTLSEEHKRKLSESKRGEKNPNFGKIPWNKK